MDLRSRYEQARATLEVTDQCLRRARSGERIEFGEVNAEKLQERRDSQAEEIYQLEKAVLNNFGHVMPATEEDIDRQRRRILKIDFGHPIGSGGGKAGPP